MNQHHAGCRKIDPSGGAALADGSPNDHDRVEIGPTHLAFAEWQAAGLTPPNFDRLALAERVLPARVNGIP